MATKHGNHGCYIGPTHPWWRDLPDNSSADWLDPTRKPVRPAKPMSPEDRAASGCSRWSAELIALEVGRTDRPRGRQN